MKTLYWISADRQSSMNLGNMSLDQARAELLAACTDDEQRAGIDAGHLSWQDDDEVQS